MDRRVLITVALVAAIAAVGLGLFMTPDVEPVQPEEGSEAERTQGADPARATRAQPRPRPAPAPTPRSRPASSPEELQAELDQYAAQEEPIEAKRGTPEYQCMALGQQTDLIDHLMKLDADGLVDAGIHAEVASKVAQLSMRVLDDGEAIWAGDMSCEGVSDINLGGAADYLAIAQEELEEAGAGSDELVAALAALDEVDWD